MLFKVGLESIDGLTLVAGRHAFETRVTFKLTPADKVDQPDEPRFVELRDVHLTIDGMARDRGLPKDPATRDLLLSWYGFETLRDGDRSVFIDWEYLKSHEVDVDKLGEHLQQPHFVDVPVPMGFHVATGR